MHDHEDDSEDEERVPLFDATANCKVNTQKWINQTNKMIKKCCEYEGLQYTSMDDFPISHYYREFSSISLCCD